MPKETEISVWSTVRGEDESGAEYILRLLVQDLQYLAVEPELLLRAFWFPGPDYVADDLANDFDTRLEQAKRCVEEGLLTDEQYAKAMVVDDLLDEMSDRHDPMLWTDEALSYRDEWAKVRDLAMEALAAMGYDLEPPPPWQETTVVQFAGRTWIDRFRYWWHSRRRKG